MSAPLNVLIVDDEPKICQVLSQILIARGCTVRTACDGLQALGLFRDQPAEVVITDLKMPKIGGVELLRELKRLDPLLNVVVITAFPSVDTAVEAMQQGACDFITKPFDIIQVQAILYRCQQRLSLTRQLRSTGEGALKLEELNRRLLELNDLKSQFLASISHEINTPLCLMGEWMYLMSDKALGQLSEEQQHAMEVLIGSYERLRRLLQQLIDLMHGSNIVLHAQPIPVQDLIQQAVATVLPKAAVRGITVTTHLPEAPLSIEVDRLRCLSMCEYLLDNAVKFNHEHGRVDVEVLSLPEAVHITVRDSGIGIPSTEQEKVFVPFYQVDRRLNRMYEGAGIGLTLARRYVEMHGGSLTLASEPGRGTTITVAIPRHATAPAPSTPEASAF